ncbi:hypothetical protein [Kaarinaea lacus]
MLMQTFFEHLSIVIMSAGILLILVMFSPIGIIAGSGMIIAGMIMVYIHYLQQGTSPDIFN